MRLKMNIDVIIVAAMLTVALCSFGFLAYMMLADWRALGRTKGAFVFCHQVRILSAIAASM
ncbi:MAG: hypothetical protein WBG50_17670 [Desulfomonilaceae bacterium]